MTGYRINYTSWKRILWSLFEWHNETINIWSHLLGFIAFFIILLVLGFSDIGENIDPHRTLSGAHAFLMQPHDWNFGLIKSQQNELSSVLSTIEQSLFAEQIKNGAYKPVFHTGFKHSEDVSKWPIVAFLITALCCLGCSTMCHWFWAKNCKLCNVFTCLDYWGITLLIMGTSYPFISYRYACGYLIVWRYIFVIILTICTTLCMVVTVNPTFLKDLPKMILFCSFGIFCFVPTLVLYIIDDPDYGLKPGMAPLSWGVLCYLVGMAFFAAKFPERMTKSGRFDNFLQSHNIHHICVLLGLTFSLLESFDVYQQRLNFVCPAEPDAQPDF